MTGHVASLLGLVEVGLRGGPRPRSIASLAAAVVVALGGVVGCFDGAAATGLPCNSDLDCGLADRCIDGFCGGPPATSTTSTDPTSESSGTTDPGTSTGDSFCEGPPIGSCTPLVPGQSDANCDSDCTFPSCGDGLYNEDALNNQLRPPAPEECDDGIQGTPTDSPTCNFDCTKPKCGDGYFNVAAVAIEECEDTNEEDFDECTNDCRVPLSTGPFAEWTSEPYDLSSYDTASADWVFDPRDPGMTVVTGWVFSNGWNSAETPYYDGIQPLTKIENYAGFTRLIGPVIALPAVPMGFRLELRFRHSFEPEADCVGEGFRHRGDGGVVRLIDVTAGGEESKLAPDKGYPDTLVDACTDPDDINVRPNPLVVDSAGADAFTGEVITDQEVHIDLSMHAQKEIRIAFDFGNDCVHCTGSFLGPAVWQIDDVVIVLSPG